MGRMLEGVNLISRSARMLFKIIIFQKITRNLRTRKEKKTINTCYL
jgi:hypothetical protein